jgi:hypothetical protein
MSVDSVESLNDATEFQERSRNTFGKMLAKSATFSAKGAVVERRPIQIRNLTKP